VFIVSKHYTIKRGFFFAHLKGSQKFLQNDVHSEENDIQTILRNWIPDRVWDDGISKTAKLHGICFALTIHLNFTNSVKPFSCLPRWGTLLLLPMTSFRRKPESSYIKSVYKSFHSGFFCSINSNFHFLFHSLIAFSRTIADSMPECSSYQTRI
jgi:hypothetical protein